MAKHGPRHLSPEAREWFRRVDAEYKLEEHHLKLLQLAAEAWDRCTEARGILAKDGIIFTDVRGKPRPHPAVAIERDARLAFARLVRELRLDDEPAPDVRPPRMR